MTTNNNYILCQWRDAITDPPPDGWCGIAKREDQHSMLVRSFLLQPGDQWLDVTDRPAVAREAVQAAVDEMARFNCRNIGIQNGAWSGRIVLDASLDTIRNHTGITPTEVPK